MSEVENMVDAIEKLVDKKIANAMRGGTSTVPATYMGTDSEGKAWVVLAGADAATPVRRTSVEAARGDMVSVTVSDGMAVIDANLTDKSAGVASVAKADEKAVVAQETAVEAIDYASQASAAAGVAQSSASTAYAAAQTAQASADSAVADAARANEAATQAISDAATAHDAADSAQESADKATYALSDVERVVGTVNWIAEHGHYELTTDTVVDGSKVYYTRSGSGTTADPYVYAVVSEPKASELSTYYELYVDESVQNFINSHLWLTNAGLNLTVDRDGQTGDQRIHLGTVDGNMDTGVYVINENGYIVSAFADGYSTFRDETGQVQASFGTYGGFVGPAHGGSRFVIGSNNMTLYNSAGHICFSVTGGSSSTESYREVVDVKAGYTLSDFVYAGGPGMQEATVSSVMVDGESVSFTTEPISAEQILPNGYSISTGNMSVILDAPVTGPARIVAEGTLPVPDATAVIGSPFASHVEITNDGVEIGDGNGDIVCSITSDGARIGRDDESNVEISGRSIEMSDAEKCLLSISFDGLVNIVNSGGNPSVSPYSEQDLIGIISMLNSGYTVSGTSVLDPEGNATLYTVRNGVVNNRYGESVHSPTKYIYYNDVDLVFEDATLMSAQVEVEVIPTVVSFGDASVRAKDGRIQIDSFGVSEGVASTASGMYSHAQNVGTTAASYSQTALGKFNVEDANDDYAVIVGNGADDSNRSNALTVDWNGNATVGGVYSKGNLHFKSNVGNASLEGETHFVTNANDYSHYLTTKAGAGSAVEVGTSADNGTAAGAYIGCLNMCDKNAYWAGRCGVRTQNGSNYAFLGVRNTKADGTDVTNYINLIVDKNGTVRYGLSNPSAFRSAIGAAMYDFYQATGASGTKSITAGTITPITLVTTGAVSNGSGFSISNGGIKVAEAGKYRITASIYILGTNATFKGVYVKKNNSSTGPTGELFGLHYPYTDSGVQVGPKVVTLAANDVLYLCGRMGGVAGTIYTDNKQTFLLVERIA